MIDADKLTNTELAAPMSKPATKPHFVLRNQVPINITMRARHGNLYSSCKLCDEQVSDIRARYKLGSVTQQTIADEYGISRVLVSQIVSGRRYGFRTRRGT